MSKFNYANIKEMFITSDMTLSSYLSLLITLHYMETPYYVHTLMMAGFVILSNCYNHYLNVKRKLIIKGKKYISILIMMVVVFTYLPFSYLGIIPNILVAVPFYIALLLASLYIGVEIKTRPTLNEMKFAFIPTDKNHLLIDLYSVVDVERSYYYSTKNNYYYSENKLYKNKKDLINFKNGIDLNLLVEITESKKFNDLNKDDLLITEMVAI